LQLLPDAANRHAAMLKITIRNERIRAFRLTWIATHSINAATEQ
jgi:hypothetical protein